MNKTKDIDGEVVDEVNKLKKRRKEKEREMVL